MLFNRSLTSFSNYVLDKYGKKIVGNKYIKRFLIKKALKASENNYLNNINTQRFPVGVCSDRYEISKALIYTLDRLLEKPTLSDATVQKIVNNLIKEVLIKKGDKKKRIAFEEVHKRKPPLLLVISPTMTCNLQCKNCYADSGSTSEKLDWEVFDQILTQVKEQFGLKFIVISGGEPFTYKDQGKDLLDMIEKHDDLFFMAYTNGLLIDDEKAERLAKLGNFTPAISLEGWRDRTDTRRGEGVFDKILETFERLRKYGIPFGISLTATKDNYEEMLSDEFIDFLFFSEEASYGWIFHYMPIGRSFTLDLMPTPEQRLWMWKRTWDLIKNRNIFLCDFWNHGTLVNGCIAGGRYNGGGYLYIDWNGMVMPCVFVPYSPVNVNDVFAQGKTMTDIWQESFFMHIREWQEDYKNGKDRHGNWLAPCIIRDHHDDFRKIVALTEPDPENNPAKEALLDNDYIEGMVRYGKKYQELSGRIWEDQYINAKEK